jgi:VCBS repeat-containing protein
MASSPLAGGRCARRPRRFLPTCEPLEGREVPAVFTVTSLLDAGPGTLRAAITQANGNDENDTINFTVAGTIGLGSTLALIEASRSVTINGAGVTVSGGGTVRVFDVAAGVTAAMTGLTVTGGFHQIEGAGIRNAGSLNLTGCTVRGNQAGTTITSGSGGGFFNAAGGALTLTNCEVVSNGATAFTTGAQGGGGGLNNGTLNVLGTTFAGNASASFGGGLLNNGTLSIGWSTFAGNGGNGGAAIYSNGALTATDTTIAGNPSLGGGGALAVAAGTAILANTIVAGNVTSPGGSPSDVTGALDLGSSFNLIGGAASSGGLVNGVNGNIVGVANPGLAPLGDYGGPTRTVALLPGSPALDAARPFLLAPPSDQRGLPRLNDLAAVPNAAGSDGRDIGAYESRGFALAATGGTPQSAVVGQPFAAPLRATLTANDPNVPLNGVVITFTPPAAGASAVLSSGTATTNTTGVASVTATANAVVGSYTVTAAGPSVFPVAFALTNLPANAPPAAGNDAYSVAEDQTLSVLAPGVLGNDTDPNGDTLTAVLVDGPDHGSLTLNANGSFTYTPAANYNGPDSFTYRASDGALQSNVATVTLTVTAVNDAPVAQPDSYTTAEDTTLTVPAPGLLANDTDVDGDALTAVQVTGPAHGTLTLNSNGSFSYTPALNYNGPDSFTYRASDGAAESAAVTVSLTVTAVNDAPVVNDQTLSVGLVLALPGTTVGTVQATDVDEGDTLTYQIVSGNVSLLGSPFSIDPQTGRIRVANTLALATGLIGGFDLVVRVTDAAGLSDTAVIHIDVTLL